MEHADRRDFPRPLTSKSRRNEPRPATVIPLRPGQAKIGRLSTRELEALELTADGLTNGEIARRLFLSEETVKSHQRHLLAKLQARSRAHAVATAAEKGEATP
jgi:DNA-binding CsgD family transcriptional regulator